MGLPLTPDAFCDSAREFALSALDAHHLRRFRRVAVDSATCLEHLAKACLVSRSPALLAELRGEGNFPSLLLLLGITGGKPPRQLRTVSLRDALARAGVFVQSRVNETDLLMLVDMRDGTVHAAQNDEVEERLLVAFVRQADAFLADLGRDRAIFWAGQVGMVDALVAESVGKAARDVAVRIAAARAEFSRRFGDAPATLLAMARHMAGSARLAGEEERLECPACGSPGVATGDHEVDWDYERDETGRFVATRGKVWMNADAFDCDVCGLHLEDEDELTAAGLELRWLVPGADPNHYDPGFDEDLVYEAWRDERRERDEREDDWAAEEQSRW